MNAPDKRRIGEQVEPGGRRKAPGRLELLQRFVNTWNDDLPVEWDRLGTPERTGSWLGARRLVSKGTRISARDAAGLRELREAFRELALANQGIAPRAGALGVLRGASAQATLRVDVDPTGRTTLEPPPGGIDRAVATLLAILHEAQVTGIWSRFKGCRQCGYGFYDRSKNHSAAWCAMSICGNRLKNRAYRRRRKAR
jgi:predicted RNA-binding Zn ribbon-like protein